MSVSSTRRALTGAVLAALVAAAIPLAGATAGGRDSGSYQLPRLTHAGDAAAVASAARVRPVVLGGKTAQGWPVVIQTSTSGKKVSALAGIEASSASGLLTVPDSFTNLAVRAGRFRAEWGPERVDLGDGLVAELSGSIAGKLTRDRGKATGTWSYRCVVKDAAGTVQDTLDSGTVTWTARQ